MWVIIAGLAVVLAQSTQPGPGSKPPEIQVSPTEPPASPTRSGRRRLNDRSKATTPYGPECS
jgi:hypothetical protein